MPISPQTTSVTRLVSARESHAGSAANPPSCSRGWGHRTARATNEMTSTTAAAQPNSHSGIGRSVRPTMPCAILEDHEGSTTSRAISGSLPASSAVWLSISKMPSMSALKRKLAGAPRLGLLLDVVAVQVDLVGRGLVGAHLHADLVALRDLDPLDAALGRAVAQGDLLRRRRRRLARSRSAPWRSSCRPAWLPWCRPPCPPGSSALSLLSEGLSAMNATATTATASTIRPARPRLDMSASWFGTAVWRGAGKLCVRRREAVRGRPGSGPAARRR